MKAEIELIGLDFFAYHGFYEEERKIGNKYTLDIKVVTNLSNSQTQHLDSTINYVLLGQIAQKHMNIPTLLLEEIGVNIAKEILATFEKAESVSVSVAKHNPPIGLVCKKSKVTIHLNR